MTRLILIEGIPGSGKTTTARWLHGWLVERGIDAECSSELRPDHPVIDRSLMKTARRAGYADRCVEAWRSFTSRTLASSSPSVHVLEACLFQGSVRFLLEHDHPKNEPAEYFEAVEQLLEPLQPRIIYLIQADPTAFMRDQHDARKGKEIIEKIAAYTETTAIAKRHNWTGREGMIKFYLDYRETCDRLLKASRLDILHLDTTSDDWTKVQSDITTWLT